MLDELFATGSRDDWVAKLRGADIVAAPINTLLEASNDPDVLANGYVAEIDYPEHGKRLKVHGSPWQFSETPAKIGVAPETRRAQRRNPGEDRLHHGADRRFPGTERSSDADTCSRRGDRSSAFRGPSRGSSRVKKVYGCEVHHTSKRRERLDFLLLILLSSRCGPRCVAPGANNQQIVQSCKTLKR